MKLRTKFAIVLVATLLLLSAVNVGALVFIQNQAVDQTESNVQQTANRTAAQLVSTLGSNKDRVALLAQKHDGTNLSEPRPYIESFLKNSRFWRVEVIAANGSRMYLSGPFTEDEHRKLLGQTVDDPYIQEALTGALAVSQPENVTGWEQQSLAFAAPIFGGEDGLEVVGVLVAGLRIDENSVFQMVKPLEGDTRTVKVTSKDGQVIKAQHTTFENEITGTAHLENMGWTVTVAKDRSQLDERLRWLGFLQAGSLLVVFGSVIGFGFWEYRSNLVQTEKLLSGFQRIRGGNYDARLSLASAEEWRQISDGFNDLAKGLAEREAALREQQQRLSVLNRVIRHNLRNEMTIILNYAELIRETTEDDTAETAAGTIASTGRKLTDLSQKARQIENALETAEEGFPDQDVVDLIEHALSNLRRDYPDIDVDLRGPEELSVAAIPALSKAIENVLENAFEHNDSDDPYVAVELDTLVRDGERRVTISVVDNGPGIPEQEKNVLVAGRETALEHGSGLGLWLVYWVVDKSDGKLRFDENEPRGSIVTLELHAAAPEDYTPSAPIEDDSVADDDSDTEDSDARADAPPSTTEDD